MHAWPFTWVLGSELILTLMQQELLPTVQSLQPPYWALEKNVHLELVRDGSGDKGPAFKCDG